MASTQAVPSAHSVPSFAGLGRRAAAYVIDLLIALLTLLTVSFAMRGLRELGVWALPQGMEPVVIWNSLTGPMKLAIIVTFIISLGPIYLGFFEASGWQASIGKRIFNLYVTDTTGCRLSLGRSLGRSLAKMVFNLFYLALLSVITILATNKKQALHDFAAKTVVVRGRPVPGGSLESWRIATAFGIPFVWTLITFLAAFQSVD